MKKEKETNIRENIIIYAEKHAIMLYFLDDESFDGGIIGIITKEKENKIVYNYEDMACSLAKSYQKTDSKLSDEDAYTEAIEWIDYNTIRYIAYDPIVCVTHTDKYQYKHRHKDNFISIKDIIKEVSTYDEK